MTNGKASAAGKEEALFGKGGATAEAMTSFRGRRRRSGGAATTTMHLLLPARDEEQQGAAAATPLLLNIFWKERDREKKKSFFLLSFFQRTRARLVFRLFLSSLFFLPLSLPLRGHFLRGAFKVR